MRLTEKAALNETINLWTFLAETGASKTDWDGWGKWGGIFAVMGGCFLCEYSKYYQTEGVCKCPIADDLLRTGAGSTCYDTPYEAWESAETPEVRKLHAKRFLDYLIELREKLLVKPKNAV